ncbi:Bax inhibitor-1/YccA family membrane protein [Streptomyces lydicus]|uniref:Bax inhibitor-1/YccA family membrane protein n=1 Tax=Streptomyces lydicus TaxID=47763 RepID=UPI00341FC5CD
MRSTGGRCGSRAGCGWRRGRRTRWPDRETWVTRGACADAGPSGDVGRHRRGDGGHVRGAGGECRARWAWYVAFALVMTLVWLYLELLRLLSYVKWW